jgi:hypothetical protein
MVAVLQDIIHHQKIVVSSSALCNFERWGELRWKMAHQSNLYRLDTFTTQRFQLNSAITCPINSMRTSGAFRILTKCFDARSESIEGIKGQ